MRSRTRHLAAVAGLAGAALLAAGCQQEPAAAPGQGPAPAPTLITGTIGVPGREGGAVVARPPARYDFRLCVAGNGVYGARAVNGPGKIEIVKDDPACTARTT